MNSKLHLHVVPIALDATLERRWTPRFDVVDQAQGELLELESPAELRDISTGGFACETRVKLENGALYHFRFTRKQQSMTVAAYLVHSLRINSSDGSTRYLTGLKFADEQQPDVQAAIVALVDRLADR